MTGPTAMMSGGAAPNLLDIRASVRLLARTLRPERGLVALTTLLTTGSVLATVIGPKLLGDAIDLVFSGLIGRSLPAGANLADVATQMRADGQGSLADMIMATHPEPGHGIDFERLGRILGVVAVVYLVAWALGALAGQTTATIVQRSMLRLRRQVEAKLARLPLSYVDAQQRGEVLSRVTNDVDNLAQALQQTLGQLLTSVLTIVGVIVMMIWVSWLLACIALVTVPASVLVARKITRLSMPQFGKQWYFTGRLNGHVEEIYSGHELMTAFGREDEAAMVFDHHNKSVSEAGFRAQFVSGLIQPAMTVIGSLNYILIAVVGGLQVLSGATSLGDVQAFVQYSRRFSQAIAQMATAASLLQSGVASFERVLALLDAPEEQPDPVPAAEITRVRGQVTFEHVSFHYAPDVPLIDDLSFAIAPGRTVAIVGPTGAGKTTLVNLLMRFYEVTGGRITIDGTDIATLSRPRLRALTGIVLQDTWLFRGTIAENIAYGVDGASRDQIVAAARAAHVEHFVQTLVDGYDTVIGEGDMTISAGERQLVTIARAFLTDPSILLLDEATSSVDTRTELLIQQAMSRLRRGRTSLVIAHRLSTIRDADLILMMDDGRLVESGSHHELLEAGGPYSRLYESQFGRTAVPDVPDLA